MLGLSVLYVSIVLRGLAAIEPAVVAHHPDRAMPQALNAVDLLRHPAIDGLRVFPGDQKRDLAWIVDARPDIVIDDSAPIEIQPEMSRQEVDLIGEGGTLARGNLGKGHVLCLSDLGLVEPPLQNRSFLWGGPCPTSHHRRADDNPEKSRTGLFPE
jgi:hypothetical protein